MRNKFLIACIASGALMVAGAALGQPAQPPSPPPAPAAPPPYGAPITLDQAKAAAAAAEAEAKKNNFTQVIAVVDPSGSLVHLLKMDGVAYASVGIAQGKARAAATFRATTKAYQDRLATGPGQAFILALPGMIPAEGGIPIVVGGKIIGAIGVSGGTPAQDGQVGQVGVAAVH